MGNKNNDNRSSHKSRRWFLTFGLDLRAEPADEEMVKLLTADGKLVTVRKSIIAKASSGIRTSNKEIFDWMKNPSKEELK